MSEREHHLGDARCADLVLDLAGDAYRDRDLSHAAQCAACASRLRAHVSASFHARAHQTGAVLVLPESRTVGTWRGLVACLLATAAAVVVATVFWPRALDRAPTPATHWLATPSEGTLVRAGETMDPRLVAGFGAYARRDLAAADRELGAARASDGAEVARRLYLAHVKLLRNDPQAALALLRSLDYTDLPAAVSRDAVRLLAQALRAEGEVASADSLDRALARSPEWAPILP